MIKRSGSGSSLLLIEQVIVIAVFALCASVCVRIFAESYIISSASADMNNAVLVAENGAECFKAMPDDPPGIAKILWGDVKNGSVEVYYDERWRPAALSGASYLMRMEPSKGTGEDEGLVYCGVKVERLGDGANAGLILELTAAARKER